MICVRPDGGCEKRAWDSMTSRKSCAAGFCCSQVIPRLLGVMGSSTATEGHHVHYSHLPWALLLKSSTSRISNLGCDRALRVPSTNMRSTHGTSGQGGQATLSLKIDQKSQNRCLLLLSCRHGELCMPAPAPAVWCWEGYRCSTANAKHLPHVLSQRVLTCRPTCFPGSFSSP